MECEMMDDPTENINKMYGNFVDILLQTWSEFVTLKVDKLDSQLKKPWMTVALLKSIRKQHQLFVKVKKNPTDMVMKEKHKKYKSVLTKTIQSAKKKYHDRFVSQIKSEPASAWNKIKELMGKAKRRPQKKNDISEEVFCDFFTNVGPKLAEQIEKTEEDPLDSIKHKTNSSMYFRSVDDLEVLKLLKKLDIKKAVGSDQVSALLLREGAETIAPQLAFLCRLSLKHGKVFDLMKIAKITPIFKAEDPRLPSNYRPVSVLSVLSTILDRLVHIRLTEFFSEILTKHQYGFRKKLNTELALINFYQSLIEKLDKGQLGFGLFIDLKKAFDTVDHQILLRKLERYGVCGPVLEWFKDYLTGRQQYVKLNGKKSTLKTVLCGVPQGSILGPLLFIIYVNDLPDILDKLEATIFADDTTLVSYAKDIDTLETTANQELKTVASWFKKNKLTFNAKKTYYLVFSHEQCHKLRKMNIEINGNQIEQKDKIKHLGVIFHEHLRWHGHINHVLSKILKYLPVFGYIRQFVTRKTLMTIYNSFIYPHLIYCSLVWGNRIQNEGVIDRLLIFQKKKKSNHDVCTTAPRSNRARSTINEKIENAQHIRSNPVQNIELCTRITRRALSDNNFTDGICMQTRFTKKSITR
jgi:hypothetical protein